MKPIMYFISFLLIWGGCSTKDDTPHQKQSEAQAQLVLTGKKTARKLIQTLKHELVTALEAGDTLAALQLCNIKALPLTTSIVDSANGIIDVRRVSFKHRNPRNVPDDIDSMAILAFKKASQFKSGLSYKLIRDNADKELYRYYQPLRTGKFCLSCHGKNISPQISERLQQLYPNDTATGYTTGEFRGVICITLKKNWK